MACIADFLFVWYPVSCRCSLHEGLLASVSQVPDGMTKRFCDQISARLQGFENMYRRFVSTPGDSLSLQVHPLHDGLESVVPKSNEHADMATMSTALQCCGHTLT